MAVETAKLLITADSTQAVGAIGELNGKLTDTSKTTSGMKSAMDNFKKNWIGVAVAVSGAVIALKGFVKSAAESERAEAQLNSVLKSTNYAAGLTADQLKKMAKGFQDVTTYSDEAVLGVESLLLTFTNIGGDIMPQATEAVLDMSTALGQDLKSSAVQLGKALQDPIAGITALRRVGVNFTDTQKQMIDNMLKLGDVSGAQKLILKELSTEFGGSAQAAAKTFDGQMKQLANTFDDVKELIGAVIIPIISELGKVIKSILSWFLGLNSGVRNFIIILGLLGGAALIATKVVMAFGVSFSAAIWPVTAVVAGIALLIAFAKNFDQLKFAADNFTDSLFNMGEVGKSVAMAFRNFGNTARAGLTVVKAQIQGVVEGIKGDKNASDNLKKNLDKAKAQFTDYNFKTREEIKKGWEEKNGTAKNGTESQEKIIANTIEKQKAMMNEANKDTLQKDIEKYKQLTDNMITEEEMKNALRQELTAVNMQSEMDTLVNNLGLKESYEAASLARRLKMAGKNAEAKVLIEKMSMKAEENFNKQRLSNFNSWAGFMQGAQESHFRAIWGVYKAAAISQTIVNTYQAAVAGYNAMVGIPFVGPALAIAAAASAVAFGLEQVHKISAQPPPKKMAEGGVVMPRSGGTTITVAESGSPEAIVPLDRAEMGGAHYHLHVGTLIGGKDIPLDTIKALDRGFYRLKQDRNSLFATAIGGAR